MRDVVLGRSGIRVSELCLGTMTFGSSRGWGAPEETCAAVYADYRDAGGNFIDTANLYTGGDSESILGRLIAGHRDEVTLATKFGMPSGGRGPNAAGASRKSLRNSVDTSLGRLGTDHLDLLWLHAPDEGTPAEELLRGLDDLVRSGKVLAIGVSNTPAWVVARSVAIAELRGWTTFCGIQVEYSLGARTPDRELLPMAAAMGLAVTAWSPLARGVLTGKATSKPLPRRLERARHVVLAVATQLETTPARVALAWVLSRGVIPVLGARTQAQLQDNLGAPGVALGAEHLNALRAATSVELGYPHEFLAQRRAVLQPDVLFPERIQALT